ncbi:type II toxin-antitoxin system VapC family toxin [Brasilonema sp. UFV-L1]|uniref:PIN domain-containing protein n=1 Tax=Brasilonema sp. UFV-L1 TaxID=2234130 RepID=UPI00145D1034|nr:type II toxin-antitoxin system VapC family toxin [Brasilonema sp. UFV-L1]
MKGYLFDTNILSELRKGKRCHPGVAGWFELVDEQDIFLSVLVIGEIESGIERIRRRDQKAATNLDIWLKKIVTGYENRILPITQAITLEWGRINVPNPVSGVDGLLAATAKVHDLTLITRNVKDIQNIGVEFYNPFTYA